MRMEGKCMYCGDGSKELRPYGEGGGLVCFSCAMGDDKRREMAEDQFAGRLALAATQSPYGMAMISDGMPPVPIFTEITLATAGEDGGRDE